MQKLRIGVLMGGKSLEKEVSFNSGRTVCDYLDAAHYEIIPLYQIQSTIYVLPWHFLHRGKTTDFEHRLPQEAQLIAWNDLKNHIDFMYIAQHGRYAEDGTLQGFLTILGIPYLGSGVLPSALRTDKILHKTFLQNAGIATPRFVAVEPYEVDNFEQYKNEIFNRLMDAGITTEINNSAPTVCSSARPELVEGYPRALEENPSTGSGRTEIEYVVKPYNEGSSLGISLVTTDNLEHALKKACYIQPGEKKRVLIEEKITGMEFTCIVLTDYKTGELFALPPTESIANQDIGFFDYEQKYMPGKGTKRTPARCSAEITKRIQDTCINVMRTLEFTSMCRIDGFVTADDEIIIIDPNTLSGMAPSSYIFNQAAEINMSPAQLINHIITTELYRYNMLTPTTEQENTQTNAAQKIRVAVLLGGKSNEKEISLESGRNVFYKLSPHKYDPIPVFVSDALELYILTQSQLVRNSTKEITELLQPQQKITWNSLPTIADFVFIALHGGEGENGCVQGTLEMLSMPYNGSSVLASALCMNKYKTNQLLAAHGFDVPKNVLVTRNRSFDTFFSANATKNTQDERRKEPDSLSARPECHVSGVSKGNERIKQITDQLAFPLIVKPHDDGCSVMVQKVKNDDELITAINTILQEKDAALVEECITGMELTVGVMGNDHPRALPPSQAVTTQDILSIEEKFLPGAGENQTPALLPPTILEFVQRTMERAFSTLQCKGYSRIDCFYQTATQSPTSKERVIILENNTLPGLTPATCLFHQAAEIGLKPMEFIDTLITLGFEEHAPAYVVDTEQIHKEL